MAGPLDSGGRVRRRAAEGGRNSQELIDLPSHIRGQADVNALTPVYLGTGGKDAAPAVPVMGTETRYEKNAKPRASLIIHGTPPRPEGKGQ